MHNDIFIALETTNVNLDCDAPVSNVGKGPAKPSHLGYHLYDALCAPTVSANQNNIFFADFNRIEYRLAEKISSNVDSTIWTITLRQGVISNYGNELTAVDVKWSYDRLLRMQSIGMWRAYNIAGIDINNGIKILDKYTLEYKLVGPNPVFPRFLCFATGAIIDSTEAQKHVTKDDLNCLKFLAENQCGFGSWTISKWDESFLELLPKNNNFTKDIPINKVTYVSALSRKKALDMFNSNQVNILAGIYPDEARQLQGKNDRLLQARTNHSFLELNQTKEPFNDLMLRQEIQMHLDRIKIIQDGYFGYAEEQKSILQPNSPEYNENAFKRFIKSKLKEKSEYQNKTNETITLAIPSSQEAKRIAVIIKNLLKNYNIEVSIKEFNLIQKEETPHAYLRADCSHGICDSFYDIALDFAPPKGMPGRSFQVSRKSADLKKIRSADNSEKNKLYEELDYEILSKAETIPIAGHHYLIGFKEQINPWVFTQEYLPMISLMWSAARYIIAPIR